MKKLLVIGALICFIGAAIGFPDVPVNLVAVGLALFMGSLLADN